MRHTRKLRSGSGMRDKVEAVEFLFQVDKETNLIVELMDIREELNAIRTVLGQQREVLSQLGQLFRGNLHLRGEERQAAPRASILSDPNLLKETLELVEKNLKGVHELLGYVEQVEQSVCQSHSA